MLTKLAVIRDPDAPIGRPARCWIRCPCGGERLEVSTLGAKGTVTCTCGATYTRSGWLVPVGRTSEELIEGPQDPCPDCKNPLEFCVCDEEVEED